MADARIKYISTIARGHEGITHVGSDGWRQTIAEVIRSIEAETNTFYIKLGTARAELRVFDGKWLRAQVDGRWNDGLLELPAFPATWRS